MNNPETQATLGR